MTTGLLHFAAPGTPTITVTDPVSGATATVSTNVTAASGVTVNAWQGVRSLTDPISGDTFKYQVWLPPTYNAAVPTPILVFMNGTGENGSDGSLQLTWIDPAIRARGNTFNAMCVALQRPSGTSDAGAGWLRQIMVALNNTIAEYNGDTTRLWVNGMSQGAIFGYKLVYQNPGVFAAQAQMSDGVNPAIFGQPDVPSTITLLKNNAAFASIPTHQYHCIGDPNATTPIADADALNAGMQSVGAPWTEYRIPGNAHETGWDVPYADNAYWSWLQAQQKASNYDSATFNASTGAGIGGSTGTPVAFDAASLWPNDAAFRAQILNGGGVGSGAVLAPYRDASKAGTNGNSSTCRYGGGVGFAPDLIDLDNVVTYQGLQTYKYTIVGANGGGTSAVPQIHLRVPSTVQSTWVWVRKRYPAGFTAVGDADSTAGIAYNSGQAASYKAGPNALYNAGSFRWEVSNGSGTGGTYDHLASPYSGGIAESYAGAGLTTEWTDGNWYDYLAHFEQWTGANGNAWVGEVLYIRKQGASHYSRVGVRRTQDTGRTALDHALCAGGSPLNYNQSRKTDITFNIWAPAVWDDTQTPDPFGVKAYEATLTPEASTLGALTSQTSSSATFPITIGRFGAYIRPVVDGVELTAQEYAFPREQPDVAYASNGTASVAQFVLSRTVTGLASGSRSIKFRVYNGSKSAYAETAARTVTI